MNDATILSHVDHTLLLATASWTEIQKICDEATLFKTASVCIPPSYVARIAETYPGLVVDTVIGFPLGYSATEAKQVEIAKALDEGATEFDTVINIGDVKNGDFQKVTEEIAILKETVENGILKVIVETCYLTEEEKIALCKCVSDGGADYIKTSTGFGTGGATPDDVLLFKKHIAPEVKIKAAGGIRTREDMVNYIEAGVDRLGTSSAIKILAGAQTEGY
jgi:deoxyribose-phosphate aldolase